MHKVNYPDGAFKERYLLAFADSMIPGFEKVLGFPINELMDSGRRVLRLDPASQRDIESTMDRMLAAETSQGSWSRSMCAALACELLALLREALPEHPEEHGDLIRHPRVTLISRIIQRRFAEDLDVGEIACAAGLSMYCAMRVFKEHTGFTVIEDLNYTRVTEAVRLM